jgi:tetratricopeptide (TPR) repeat protein
MKKVSLFLGILLFATFVYMFVSDNNQTQLLSQSPKASSGTRKLFLGARAKSSNISTTENPYPNECLTLTSQLEVIDFNESSEDWRQSLEFSALDECEDEAAQARIADVHTFCFDNFQEDECARHTVFLRALLRTKDIHDSDERDILADLILREFAGETPDFKQLINHSDKLLSLEPNQPSFQKLFAAASVISALDGKADLAALKSALDQRIDSDLWQDTEMQGLKLAVETGLEPGNVELFARELLNQNESSKMQEILGWSLWRQNRFEEAEDALRRAIELNPHDPWLKDQLKKIHSKNAGEDSYQARISLGFNLEDLYN